MKAIFEAYTSQEKLAPLVREIGWSHNLAFNVPFRANARPAAALWRIRALRPGPSALARDWPEKPALAAPRGQRPSIRRLRFALRRMMPGSPDHGAATSPLLFSPLSFFLRPTTPVPPRRSARGYPARRSGISTTVTVRRASPRWSPSERRARLLKSIISRPGWPAFRIALQTRAMTLSSGPAISTSMCGNSGGFLAMLEASYKTVCKLSRLRHSAPVSRLCSRTNTAATPHATTDFATRAASGVALRCGRAAIFLQCHQWLKNMWMSLLPMSLLKRSADLHPVLLGASLRDRATLPSPLRGLGPPGGYPSRLRSLRSLRAPLARRLAALPPSPARRSTIHCTAMPQPHRADATRRAFRVPRPAHPRQLRWRRALPGRFACSAVAFPQTTRRARCRCRLRRTPATAQQLALKPRTSSRRETGARLAPAPVPLPSNRSPLQKAHAHAPLRLFPQKQQPPSALRLYRVPFSFAVRIAALFSHHTHLGCPVHQVRACHAVPCARGDKYGLQIVGASECVPHTS